MLVNNFLAAGAYRSTILPLIDEDLPHPIKNGGENQKKRTSVVQNVLSDQPFIPLSNDGQSDQKEASSRAVPPMEAGSRG